MDFLTQFLAGKNEAMQMKNWQVILLVVVVLGAVAFVLGMPLHDVHTK